MKRSWTASCCSATSGRPSATTYESSNAGCDRIRDQLRTYKMDMAIDSTSCQNATFSSNDVCGHANNHTRSDKVHNIRISCFSNTNYFIALYQILYTLQKQKFFQKVQIRGNIYKNFTQVLFRMATLKCESYTASKK